ncbi:hypothetical protein PFICI_13423 [Pestalotiopsis fici W106-1]|uniref:Signal peptide-containing protein n=1 Tax=Pestalotiopsis fici (strain W106-1 / CGMCC3.15140) TaxID=1229662 RepID=W3WME9_PESFW|nr:uncharacterized protein PFICI_13423 [Pestalotiopsis fici W106-1]ETS74939.1 hypothetical protein PFICI_13423 [Pestalotiopsis fici W106-1]
MQFSTSTVLALFAAAGALALPEAQTQNAERCVANLPNCAGSSHIGGDKCRCSGQVAPCGNWKCGWDGPHSILNCGSHGSGCHWIN